MTNEHTQAKSECCDACLFYQLVDGEPCPRCKDVDCHCHLAPEQAKDWKTEFHDRFHWTHDHHGKGFLFDMAGQQTVDEVIMEGYITQLLAERDAETERLLTKADSFLSLLVSRVNIPWGTVGIPERYEVEKVIGELRTAALKVIRGKKD